MIQSIGVIIAAVIIHIWGDKNKDVLIVDPICTYLFSILVIFTTVPVFRDCMSVLMESNPKGVNVKKMREDILKLKDVQRVDDMHCWPLAGNKNCLIVHVRLTPLEPGTVAETFTSNRYHTVYSQIKRIVEKFDICHFTIQIL